MIECINLIEWFSGAWRVVIIGCLFTLQMCWLNAFFVNIFFTKSELFIRVYFNSLLDILFRSSIVSNPVRNSVYWKVNVILLIVDILKCFKYFFSKVGFKLVVIFTLNMYNELEIISLSTFSNSFNRMNVDSSLYSVLFNVINILICKQ